jgi:ABC-type glycerol-3-phosphate transport system substrate-binding protein
MNRRFILTILVVITTLLTIIPLATLRAQSGGNVVTITLAVSDFMRDMFAEKLIADFEAAHPNIKVNVVTSSQEVPLLANGQDKYFEALQKLASAADVLFVDLGQLNSTAATRAGYFLDLAPLVQEDKTLNADDFFSMVWQFYQWDKGIWALPVSANAIGMVYDPAAFDKAGLAYPNGKWTLDDLANAARKLTQKDTDGKVTVPGLAVFPSAEAILFRSLLGEGLFDASTVPNPPQIDKPAAETMLDSWAKLDQEGVIGGDLNKAPMSIAPLFLLLNGPNTERKLAGTLLPGGKAGLDVQGFAVSGGTQHPMEAYALASFLTTRPEISNRFVGVPARKSLIGAEGNAPGPRFDAPPEFRKLQDEAIANGLPLSELRYADYLLLALQKMKNDRLDAKAALEAAEVEAVKAQQAAADKKTTLSLAVATPIPEPPQKAGEITLNFGLTSFIMPLPNRERWDQLLNDFARDDPQVGKVNLNVGFNPVDEAATKFDCFYQPFNAVPNAKLDKLLNLDPFLSADSTFDKNDVIGNIMAQLQRDNKTWALPVVIEPSILEYNVEKFASAGVPEPVNGWTIDAFNDALKALKKDPKDSPPFVPTGIGGTGAHLLILMAAYGGLPLDYRTDPPTINFTDPATVAAIRQVLDLAKQGYVKYDKLANPPFSPIAIFGVGQARLDPIYTQELNGFVFREGNTGNGSGDQPGSAKYKFTTYPTGTKFSAASYNVGTTYISATSQNPEACYRLISMIARTPELFSSMPARRSLIGGSTAADLSALYNSIDAILKDPDTISFPSGFAGGGAGRQVLEYWLYDAFDKYVLKDGDLEAALRDAETFAKGFQECLAKTPPPDPAAQSSPDFFRDQQCASKIDPRLKAPGQ